MKTKIKKTDDAIVVSIDGKLDFGSHLPLREDLMKIVRQAKTDSVPKKIIFDFDKLDFVGSSGISSFVQTLREFNATIASPTSYHNVKNEFKQVMRALDDDALFDFFDQPEPPTRKGRKLSN